MEPSQVLIVDDDPEFLVMLEDILAGDGYHTHPCASAEQALTALQHGRFDLVLTDIRMPRLSGIDLLARIRHMALDTDVILMTAYASLQTAIEALRLGAVDYVQKPFPSRVLRERVRRATQARRHRGLAGVCVCRQDLTLDLDARQLWVQGREVSLTCREFDLLAYLAQHSDRAVSFEELLVRVWGNGAADEFGVEAVKASVYRLRKKIGDQARTPRYIANVRGFGYQFLE